MSNAPQPQAPEPSTLVICKTCGASQNPAVALRCKCPDAATDHPGKDTPVTPPTPNEETPMATKKTPKTKGAKPKTAAKKARAPKPPKQAKPPKAPKAPKAEKAARYVACTIERPYKGKTYTIELEADGTCRCDGETYASPTALALAITGAGKRGKAISGPAWLGLHKPAGKAVVKA